MYLKSLEMIGFKSFADRTRLEFETGMTAIVGPNGCGKSNVSDAIRWVIGEQSAKALRGAKMEDCIFNGTEERKPLGMAEVSLTLGDCDGLADMDFHEITVTRRVFRSGEGQYFLNKAPCRLKDIQRLFMDTGIGAASYSLMEQGRIDQVLSSRPEDRRAIFEQASGITKFKADKREAILKLEHTEANLIRLADVIREVKRQIGSLQRQAGKARRYKDIRTRLREREIVAARDRLHGWEQERVSAEKELADARAEREQVAEAVAAMESETARLRQALAQTERQANEAAEAGLHARRQLEHTREMIEANRQTIRDYLRFSERDNAESQSIAERLAESQAQEDALQADLAARQRERDETEIRLRAAGAALESGAKRLEEIRAAMRRLREETLETENLAARLRNQLVEIETQERTTLIQREKLLAEKAQLGRVADTYEKRQEEMTGQIEGMRAHVLDQESHVERLAGERGEHWARHQSLRQREGHLKSERAAREAQVALMREAHEAGRGFSAGGRLALDPANPLGLDAARVLGALAAMVRAEDGYDIPLRAVLRAWTDAVLVADAETARAAAELLRERDDGAARLLSLDGPSPAPIPECAVGKPLLGHLSISEPARPLLERMLGSVRVVDSLAQLPAPLPPGVTLVTMDGVVARGDGSFEVWKPEPPAEDPLARRHALDAAEKARGELDEQIRAVAHDAEQVHAQWTALGRTADEARRSLEESRRLMAQKEGEYQVVSDEAREARERFQTVSWELSHLPGADHGANGAGADKERIAAKIEAMQNRREAVAVALAEQNDALHEAEALHAQRQRDESDARVRFSEAAQSQETLRQRLEHHHARHKDLEDSLRSRRDSIASYRQAADELESQIAKAEGRIAALQEDDTSAHARAEELRAESRRQADALAVAEKTAADRRRTLDELKSRDTGLEVRLAENRMRQQNLLERVSATYGIGLDQILAEPEPEWEGEKPAMDALETDIAELRTKLDAMGPVNLVAIEELRELEERHAFLVAQEEDLVKAKQDLLEMIRKINLTTTEMFRRTFDQINANFETMFGKLFRGGAAKLVLVNEEDILECGIEIIARPPGKRLQNISLLSGGERTLTAVALLFAIYMCKPSPFCLLDEMDAALDEANISRFVKILEGFLKLSQFIVITHNRQTIAAAGTLYGVTMPKKGISKIVSMKFRDFEKQAEPAA